MLCQLRYCDGVDEIIVLHSFDHTSRCLELNEGIKRVCVRAEIAAPSIPGDKSNFGRSDKPIIWKRETVNRLMERYKEEITRFGFQMPAEQV